MVQLRKQLPDGLRASRNRHHHQHHEQYPGWRPLLGQPQNQSNHTDSDKSRPSVLEYVVPHSSQLAEPCGSLAAVRRAKNADPDGTPPSSVAALFVLGSAGEQAGGLPESSRGLSDLSAVALAEAEAIPPDRIPKSPFDPGGVAELWHPSRMPTAITDRTSGSLLRPPECPSEAPHR